MDCSEWSSSGKKFSFLVHEQILKKINLFIFQKFQAHDRSHPQSDKIYAELERLSSELIQYGHKYDSTWITRPLDEYESVESVLCGHSEKLAIAFNFVQQSNPSKIQITKNLRVCGDCRK
jgi:activator of HSP90 ATPase